MFQSLCAEILQTVWEKSRKIMQMFLPVDDYFADIFYTPTLVEHHTFMVLPAAAQLIISTLR